MFESLKVQSTESVDRTDESALRKASEKFDRAVDRCDDLADEDANWAKGRWRWFLARMVKSSLIRRAKPLRRCAGAGQSNRQRKSDQPQNHCRELEQSLEKRSDLDTDEWAAELLEPPKKMLRIVDDLYEASCDLGDDAGCRGAEAERPKLPAKSTLQKALMAEAVSEKSVLDLSGGESDGRTPMMESLKDSDMESTSSDGPSGEKTQDGDSSSPKVSNDKPDVEGALEKEIIRRVVRQNRREIKYCYEKQLENQPDLEGEVMMQFTISPNGEVTSADLVRTTLNAEKVESCIANRIEGWTFPEPKGNGIVKVNYPFHFSTE